MAAQRRGVRDLDRTRENILRVAIEHFARTGYFGARVDEIAAETATTKRMIYYCYGNKDGLFTAALEHVYSGIREFEQSLGLEALPPREAITRYVGETIRFHESHPELALLVRTENVLGAEHIAPEGSGALSQGIAATLDDVLDRGRAAGEFTAGPSGIEVHIAVTALANFRITNEATIRALFGYPTREPQRLGHDIDQYVAMVLGWLMRPLGDRSDEVAFPQTDGRPAAGDHPGIRKALS